MKQTITKNDKNLKILNKLITNGFYKGYVKAEKFELKRNYFPNNYRILGILNEENKYVVKFDFDSMMSVNAKILMILGVIVSIIMLIKGNWIIPFVFIVSWLIAVIGFKMKGKKEMELFTNKFLEFYKNEYS
ncbi:hypothetical protein [Aureibaculum conchae]|uniref:hypothetical protein n=1 Tax=Aureibaculum sp. 2308TA14-22 TaxID=3108392 RepID=UPI003396B2B1